MTTLEQTEATAAEATVAGFENSLIEMLATIRAMREIGICLASKAMVIQAALAGERMH